MFQVLQNLERVPFFNCDGADEDRDFQHRSSGGVDSIIDHLKLTFVAEKLLPSLDISFLVGFACPDLAGPAQRYLDRGGGQPVERHRRRRAHFHQRPADPIHSRRHRQGSGNACRHGQHPSRGPQRPVLPHLRQRRQRRKMPDLRQLRLVQVQRGLAAITDYFFHLIAPQTNRFRQASQGRISYSE